MATLSTILLIVAVLILIKIGMNVSAIKEDTESLSDRIDNIHDRISMLEDILTDIDAPKTVEKPSDKEIPEPVIEREDEEDEQSIPVVPPRIVPPPFVPKPEPQPEYVPEPFVDEEPRQRQPRNFEKLIGENLFSKIGILILVIGVGFFVKYAIDRDWISEVTRAVLGFAVGIGLWGLAYPIRERYRSFSSVLAGGGYAVCFVTTAIAYNIYSIFTPIASLIIMVTLTAAMIGCALWLDRRELAIVAVAGGFVAPFIAGDPDGSYLMLMVYVALLDAAVFVITMRRGWWILPLISCVPTWIVAAICVFTGGNLPFRCWATLIVTIYFLMFSLPLVSVMRRNDNLPSLMTWLIIMTMANAFAYLWLATRLAAKIPFLNSVEGIFPLFVAALYAAVFCRYYRRDGMTELQNLILGLVIGFALLFWPIQFSTMSVVVSGLAATMAALSLMFTLTARRIYHYASCGVALLVMLLLTGTEPRDFDTCFWTDIICGISFLTVSWLVDRRRALYAAVIPGRKVLYGIMLWAGVIALLGGVWTLADHFAEGESALMLLMAAIAAAMLAVSLATLHGGYLLWSFPGFAALFFVLLPLNGTGDSAIGEISLWTAAALFAAVIAVSGMKGFSRNITGPLSRRVYTVYFNLSYTVLAVAVTLYGLRSAGASDSYSAGLSVAMTLCGAAQMIIGLNRHVKVVRMTGLSLFGIVIAKLVLHDLWLMSPVGRIIVFILLGVILLAISFLYQRLRTVIFADENHPGPRDPQN